MKNEQIAINWAKQLDSHGKTLNMFFEYDTIYSYGYHFPIARLYDNFALVNANKCSVTTERHKSLVKQALNNEGVYIIEAPYCDIDNANYFIEHKLEEARKKIKKVRSEKMRQLWSDEIKKYMLMSEKARKVLSKK